MGEIVLEILIDIFGEPVKKTASKGQYGFDCPLCARDKGLFVNDGKGNLEINIFKSVYKCWACSMENNMHGTVYGLIKRFGTVDQLQRFRTFSDIQIFSDNEQKTILNIPKEFTPLEFANTNDAIVREALGYLEARRVGMEMIKEFNIGFCPTGEYSHRIIIPSYDINNRLNYFVGRSFIKKKYTKYKNPDVPKDDIIFFENRISWDSTIYLTEGAFDAMVLPNAIPMLGKVLTNQLKIAIFTKSAAEVVICLDGDATASATRLFNDLNIGRLFGRVYNVTLPKNLDMSKVNEKYGRRGIIKCLSKI